MEDFFYLYQYTFSVVFLAFSFCWGFTGIITQWDEFGEKLINSVLIVGSIVFFFLLCNFGFLESAVGVLVGGLVALWIGYRLSDVVSDDWQGIAGIFGVIAFIVMFILFGARV